ncbi:60S ribosomal protein L7 [Mycena chlorophos]|uniref:60S ribosomal protein L7 n=1 Tax=Mycena chlorophos TaxID=658473 RepID=A0A8H6SRJ4_MYCCL|nr:60S ribosomal protein L7 [Mycena chlorophos]
MSNKSMPKNPSHWVSSILRPIKVFFAIGVAQGPGSALKEHFVESYAADIFEGVCQKYIFELTQLKKLEERLRRLNKGKKATSFLFGGGAKEDDGRRDEERIRQQMIIDVEAFGKDAQLLGVALEKSQCYAKLAEMVHEVDVFSTAPATLRPVADDLAFYGASRTLAGILSNDETFENIIEVHQLRPSQSHALSVPARFSITSMLLACVDLSREIIGDHPNVDESLRVLHSLGKDKAQIRGSKETYSWVIVDPGAQKIHQPERGLHYRGHPDDSSFAVTDGLNKGLDLSPEIMRPMHDSLSPRAVYITHPSKKEPTPQVRALAGAYTYPTARCALINAVRTSPADPQTAAARLPIPHVNILGRQFSPNRLEDYYYSAVQGNAMYMTYIHEAGPRPPPRHIRLTHDPENPYSKYRANPPVGGNQRGRLPPPADTPENVIRLDKIVVHSFLKQAVASRSNLLGLVMAMPQLTGETVKQAGRHKVGGVEVVYGKKSVGGWIRPNIPVGTKVELKGAPMYDFLAQLVEFVLPRLKDFPGVMLPPPSASEQSPSAVSGVVTMGLDPQALAFFPQIEVNVDSYPKSYGMHIHFVTNATGLGAENRARALLSAFQLPFTRRS